MLRAAGFFLLAAVLLTAVLWFSTGTKDEPKYTRSECVVRLNLTGLKGLEGDALVAQEDRFFDTFNPIAMAGRDTWPVSGLGFGAADRSEYFIRFWKDCDRKIAFTQQMIERYKASTDSPLDLEIDPSPVTLDVRKTLCFGGEHWIDGDEPCF